MFRLSEQPSVAYARTCRNARACATSTAPFRARDSTHPRQARPESHVPAAAPAALRSGAAAPAAPLRPPLAPRGPAAIPGPPSRGAAAPGRRALIGQACAEGRAESSAPNARLGSPAAPARPCRNAAAAPRPGTFSSCRARTRPRAAGRRPRPPRRRCRAAARRGPCWRRSPRRLLVPRRRRRGGKFRPSSRSRQQRRPAGQSSPPTPNPGGWVWLLGAGLGERARCDPAGSSPGSARRGRVAPARPRRFPAAAEGQPRPAACREKAPVRREGARTETRE